MDAHEVFELFKRTSGTPELAHAGLSGEVNGRRDMLLALLKSEDISTDTFMIGILLTDLIEGLADKD
jgi:hypothetical protein